MTKLQIDPEIAFKCSKPTSNETLSFDYKMSPLSAEIPFTVRVVKKSYYVPNFSLPLQESLAVEIPFKKWHPLDNIPSRVTEGYIGYDLTSLTNKEIPVNEIAIISTGLSVAIPEGMYSWIAEQSSWAAKGLTIGEGVINCDNRGKISNFPNNWCSVSRSLMPTKCQGEIVSTSWRFPGITVSFVVTYQQQHHWHMTKTSPLALACTEQ